MSVHLYTVPHCMSRSQSSPLWAKLMRKAQQQSGQCDCLSVHLQTVPHCIQSGRAEPCMKQQGCSLA